MALVVTVINSYRFYIGEGKGDLLQYWKLTIPVPSTAPFKQTIKNYLFSVVRDTLRVTAKK